MPLYPFIAFILVAAQAVTSEPPQTVAPPAAQTAADQNSALAGKVSNSLTGEPLKKVTVQLVPHGVPLAFGPSGPRVMDPSGAKQGYSTTSQTDGSFAFQNVKPGDYVLFGQRTGYLNTQYGAKRPMGSGTAITLRPGQQKTDLNFPLLPQAVITGKVVDEDGDPLSGVMVQAIRPQWQQGKMNDMPQGNARTNDLGEFRLAGVRPGKCYLVAQKMSFEALDGGQLAESGKPEPRPTRTFYPEALSRETATPLDMQAGQDLAGINIRMHASLTYHVRGKVAGILPESEGERMIVSLRPAGERFSFYPGNQGSLGKAHTFDIPGVAPGSYELMLQNMGGKNNLVGRQQLDVGAGDLNGFVLNVQPPASLKGRAKLEGNPSGTSAEGNLSSVHIHLGPADSFMLFGPLPNGTPGADGSFTLENVSPGKYNVGVNAPKDAYLQSVKFGAQEVRGKYLDLGAGAAGELEIVLRYGVAQVTGTIQDAKHPAISENTSAAPPPIAANVLLVPEELNEDGSGLQFNSADGSGAFTFKQLAPGRYKAFAFEDASFADLQNPQVIKQLESKGTDVEVKENDTKQIQLPLISAGDFQQVLTKLGLDPAQ